MRVALSAPYDRAKVSGISVFLNGLEGALQSRGVEVHTITPDAAPPGPSPPGFVSMALAWATFWTIALDRGVWAAVHANQAHVQSIAALLAARLKGAIFVVTYHSDLPAARGAIVRHLQLRLHRILLAHADHAVFVSEATRRALGRSSDTVLPGGVDLDLVELAKKRETERGGKSFLFAFVGRQTRSKGFFDLLEAFRILLETVGSEEPGLILIGDTPPEEQADRRRLLEALGPSVEDRGTVSDRMEVLRDLSRANAFVLPSYTEGLPLALLEAMAVGCVPIASRVGGIPEAVEDGVTGLLVSPGDSAGLALSMRRLMGHRDETLRMATAAEARVRERFSFQRSVEGYLRLYRGLRPS